MNKGLFAALVTVLKEKLENGQTSERRDGAGIAREVAYAAMSSIAQRMGLTKSDTGGADNEKLIDLIAEVAPNIREVLNDVEHYSYVRISLTKDWDVRIYSQEKDRFNKEQKFEIRTRGPLADVGDPQKVRAATIMFVPKDFTERGEASVLSFEEACKFAGIAPE